MDPVVVLVLSLGFIFSVVALHSMHTPPTVLFVEDDSLLLDRNRANARMYHSHRQNQPKVFVIGKPAFYRAGRFGEEGPTERRSQSISSGVCSTAQ